jgi:long-subunit fatty acid transport protein
MPFTERGAGSLPLASPRAPPRYARQSRASLACLVVALLWSRGRVAASPLDDPFIGGLSFSGPTSADLGAIYWNPAALGLVRGNQVMIAATGRLVNTRVSRAPIDPATGAPGGTLPTGDASASTLMQPVQWPPGPGSYLAVSTDLGGDRFALGFATYMPYVEQIHFPLSPAGDEPTRYHALNIDLRNLALVPALAIRFAGEFRIGFAPGILFSTGRLSFAEDTALDGGSAGLATNCGMGPPCQAENPNAAARLDVGSGNGLGDAKVSLTLGGGIYFRRRTFEVGVSYSSRPIGGDLSGVSIAGDQSTVTAPPLYGGGPVSCAQGSNTHCVFADINYKLPDVWIAGATWHLRPGLELTGMVRWIWFHVHDNIDIRLVGPTLDAAHVPQHIVLYRGFHDVWDARLRLAYWWRERVRVGAALRLETSAVDAAAVNPAAVDGLQIEPIVLAQVRLFGRLWIGGGYGITFMPEVTAQSSQFDPTQATACANANGDLSNSACLARLAGQARPTAAGTYRQLTQDFGMTLTARF